MAVTISKPARSQASLLLDGYGISQRKLSTLVGVSRSSLSRILQGRQPIPPELTGVLRANLGIEGAQQVLQAIRAETS